MITYNIFYRKYIGDYSELHKFTAFGTDMMQALFLFAYSLGDKHENLDNITIVKIEPVEKTKDVNQADVKKTNIVKGQYIN